MHSSSPKRLSVRLPIIYAILSTHKPHLPPNRGVSSPLGGAGENSGSGRARRRRGSEGGEGWIGNRQSQQAVDGRDSIHVTLTQMAQPRRSDVIKVTRAATDALEPAKRVKPFVL